MREEKDIAWLAGLLEGEGSFVMDDGRHRRPSRRVCIRVYLEMTDLDIVQRAADLFPTKSIIRVKDVPENPKWSCTYVKTWNGQDAENVMRSVLPYMGKRRSAKIQECLTTPNLSHQPKVVT